MKGGKKSGKIMKNDKGENLKANTKLIIKFHTCQISQK